MIFARMFDVEPVSWHWQFSRDVLKEDFRTGLKDLDGELSSYYLRNCSPLRHHIDAEQEQKNPDDFDPTINIRGAYCKVVSVTLY